jgi:hypothetical protein
LTDYINSNIYIYSSIYIYYYIYIYYIPSATPFAPVARLTHKQEQQQEGGVKLLSGLLTRTTTGPDAEPDELDLGDRESGSSPLSGMCRVSVACFTGI